MFDVTEYETTFSAGDPVAQLRVGVAELATEDHADATTYGLSQRVIDLLEIRERLDAELARVAAVWQRRRAWEADGALSPVAWLKHRAPVAAPEARQLVKKAKIIDAAPRLAAALRSGRVTSAHVGALARVVSDRRRPLLAEHDEVLAKQAERLSIGDFTLVARRWAAIADDHLADESHDEHHPRNELRAAVTMDGWIDGTFRLHPISGAKFLGVLDHLAPPDPIDAPDGVRSLAERRGDALVDLAGWYHQGAKPSANPPNLDVVVDVATLDGASPDLAKGRCDLEGVGPITRATLEQLSCGATLRRIVMAGDSVVLEMGRKTRFATPAQARAVRIRDAGCIFPSCDRPVRWCDIHHIDEFSKGGHTDVAKMCCLCTRHHTLVHNSEWTIIVNSDGSFRVCHPTRAP